MITTIQAYHNKMLIGNKILINAPLVNNIIWKLNKECQ
jgi:hypothetical protein